MKDDKMAVTRGAGSQRTHCLKGSRDIHTWTRKKQMSTKVSGELGISLWVWWEIEFAIELAALAILRELEMHTSQ